MKMLITSCSRREASWNHKLAMHIADLVKEQGNEPDLVRIHEFGIPFYDFDVQESDGFPPEVQALADRIAAADGWIVVTPEYNWSVPGEIKNAVDWLSRMSPVPMAGRSVMLTAASPSLVGGVRGLLHLRVSFESLGCWTYPKPFALAQANQAFDDDGGLKNPDIAKMLENMVADYTSGALALAKR